MNIFEKNLALFLSWSLVIGTVPGGAAYASQSVQSEAQPANTGATQSPQELQHWPFPVPLVRDKEKWFFDVDAGTQEILFRRIGENESVAIEVCHALARITLENRREPASDGVVTEYALNLVDAKRADDSHTRANPFHGYYFLRMSDDPDIDDGAALFVAYPVKYRFSGVMTFVITSDDIVFQKDLGPNTPKLARTVSKDTPDSTWQLAE
jgi:hypothetical protein